MEYNLLKEVTNYKEFLTVDELDKKLISLVGFRNVINLGKSEKSNSILCTKIGSGKKNALIFGFPHPNEPVGSLTCIELIKILLKNKKLQNMYTWYIIPCADQDGARLNEGWFKGKFTLKKHVYNFFRTQSQKQVEWTFPIKYKNYKFSKPIKPTQALMKLINKIKPEIVYTLHNASFGGAYFYITKKMPKSYYEEIINLCKKLSIPMDLGEPEMEYVKELKKPIYLEPSFEQRYDYFEKTVKNPQKFLSGGSGSIRYSMKLNPRTFGLVGEIPYFYSAKIFNKKKTSEPRRTFLRERYKVMGEVLNFIEKNIRHKDINKKSIFYSMLMDKIKDDKKSLFVLKKNINQKKYSQRATIAEKFSSLVISRFYLALPLGGFRRLLLDSRKTKEIKNLIKKTEKQINNFITYVEKHSNCKVLPIKSLVQLQLGCLFASLDYL